jgi:hypothetical protein
VCGVANSKFETQELGRKLWDKEDRKQHNNKKASKRRTGKHGETYIISSDCGSSSTFTIPFGASTSQSLSCSNGFFSVISTGASSEMVAIAGPKALSSSKWDAIPTAPTYLFAHVHSRAVRKHDSTPSPNHTSGTDQQNRSRIHAGLSK